jgi:hypothetical protein
MVNQNHPTISFIYMNPKQNYQVQAQGYVGGMESKKGQQETVDRNQMKSENVIL